MIRIKDRNGATHDPEWHAKWLVVRASLASEAEGEDYLDAADVVRGLIARVEELENRIRDCGPTCCAYNLVETEARAAAVERVRMLLQCDDIASSVEACRLIREHCLHIEDAKP